VNIEEISSSLIEKNADSIVYTKIIPSQEPQYSEICQNLPDILKNYISNNNLKLYSHQAMAIEKSLEGSNVMITTPTASGKSLAFNLSVFSKLAIDPNATALYIYPLKALTQDQLQTLKKLESETGIEARSAVYDGDTSSHQKRTIRESSRIILSNPYALHQYLPWHHKWKRFFKNLEFVVLDESHVYRGVFGSNMAMLIRRLRRIANHYGADPQFILSSATLANPEEHSENLVGVPFEIVDKSGAPQGYRHFHLWNSLNEPDDSIHSQTSKLLSYCVKQGLQSLCFTSSRRLAELVSKWSQDKSTKNLITSYRAGYTPEERREIERQFRDGELRGLASTTALELGIDIGGLDCVIISGYPGTMISTWQMAGRAGRGHQDSLVTLLAFENPLDQFFMRNPDRFFARPHEHAIVDLENPYVLSGHTMCAASELPFRPERDLGYFGENSQNAIDSLVEEKIVQETPTGMVYRGLARPTEIVSLSQIGEHSINLVHDGEILETMDMRRAFEEAHPGAVILHRGTSYIVKSLDWKAGFAEVVREEVDYFTSSLSTSDVNIKCSRQGKMTRLGELHVGDLLIHEEFSAYKVRKGDELLGLHALDLPAMDFESVGIWFTLPEKMAYHFRSAGLDWMGGLHAAEHAMIAMTPFHALCDRWDIGGLSTPQHPDTESATIFIYDGYEGGIGISEKAFDLFDQLVETTFQLIRDCDCEDGCPSCIYSPKCGNNNEPLDKRAALKILDALLD
jgi:DEAD/DEAH box helicase domain-containing protein